MNHTYKDKRRIEVIIRYFQLVDKRDLPSIASLFHPEVEIFFPQSGVIKGLNNFIKLNQELSDLIITLNHDIEDFVYTFSESRIIVEGVESGTLQNDISFSKNRFCSVFEFDSESMKITRMYVYTDPTFSNN